jgi:hypothetical protein
VSRPGSLRPRAGAALVLAASLVAAPLLSACEPPLAGSAAIVGDRRITVNDVQTATEQIRHLQGAEQATQQQVLLLLLAEPYAIDAASNAKVGVSDDDARKALVGVVTNPAQSTVDLMRANLALNRLGQQSGDAAVTQVIQQIAAASPRINPRFGRFDPKTSSLVPVTPTWIASTPAPTP